MNKDASASTEKEIGTGFEVYNFSTPCLYFLKKISGKVFESCLLA